MSRIHSIVAFAALAALASQSAAAQVVPSANDGRALDANPQVGSGGLNPQGYVPTQFNAANRYITGNVTGLGAFHGFSPIQDTTTFQAGLGSAGLTFFNRRSVSVADVLSGRAAAGLPYYGRSETVLQTGNILAGQNQPGSSMPLSPQIQPTLLRPADPRLGGPMQPMQAGELLRQGQLLSSEAILAATRRMEGLTSGTPTSTAMTPVDSYAAAAQSPLFGTGYIDPTELLKRVMAPAKDTQPADASRPPQPQAPPEVGAPVAAAPEPPAAEPGADLGASSAMGMDAFSDLVRALRAAREDQAAFVRQQSAERLAGGAQAERIAALKEQLLQARADLWDSAQGAQPVDERQSNVKRIERSAKWYAAVIEAEIATFAGQADSPFNALMLAGEKAMRDRRYYDAERTFALAQEFDPDNALAHMARGHALAAAGDYVSAVQHIESGLQLFPDLAMLTFDLNRLMGGAETCAARITDLRRRAETATNAELRFLLGYLEYFSGDRATGSDDLVEAAALARPDSVIARFPYLVLGIEKPPAANQ